MPHYISNRNYINFYLLLFVIIFIFPINSTTFMEGVPFLNKNVTICATILIPIIILFRKEIFKNNLIKYFILFFFISKLILIFAPLTGAGHKIFFHEVDQKNNKYIKTYSSFWNKDYSSIQKFKWTDKENFPLDWTVQSDINNISEKNHHVDNNYKAFTNYKTFRKFSAIDNINFYLFLDKSTEIKIDFNADSHSINKFEIFQRVFVKQELIEKKINLNIINNYNILDKGIYRINITKLFNANDWFFDIKIKNNKKVLSAFNKGMIFINLEKFNKTNLIKFYNNLSKILDGAFILFLILSFYLILNKIGFNKNLFYLIITSITFLIFTSYLKLRLSTIDGVGSISASISLIIMIILIYFYQYKKKIIKEIEFFPFIVLPSILFVFISKFYPELEAISWWGWGDDWTRFQTFARAIVVDGEWLRAGEGVFFYRPGIRYVYALIHIFFGHSGFAQKIIEVWLIFASSFLVYKILLKFNVSSYNSFIGGLLLLIVLLGDNYRWLIARGLVEYYALFSLMLLAYLFIILDIRKISNLILVGIIGMINIFLREDNIFFIFSLIFLNSMYIQDEYNNKKHLIINLTNYIIKNFYIITFYGFTLVCSIAIILIRNYYFDNSSLLGKHHNTITFIGDTSDYFGHLYMYLTASPLPSFPKILPRPSTIFLTGAFVITVLKLFNIRYLKFINFSIFMCIISCFLPILIFNYLPSYHPRFTIKYLPISIILSVIIYDNLLINIFKKINLYKKIKL